MAEIREVWMEPGSVFLIELMAQGERRTKVLFNTSDVDRNNEKIQKNRILISSLLRCKAVLIKPRGLNVGLPNFPSARSKIIRYNMYMRICIFGLFLFSDTC